MKIKSVVGVAAFLTLALVFGATTVQAQFTPPPTEALDTLNQAGTGQAPGGPAQANGDPAAAAPPPPPPPETYEEYDQYDDEYDEDADQDAQPPNPWETLQEDRVQVIAGQRVYCLIFPDKMIDDARFFEVPESQIEGNYYDDGTHGDEIADDGIYTNIEVVRGRYLSAQANELRRRTLSSLIFSETIKPMDFYMLRVVSVDTTGTLAMNNALMVEEERDRAIMEWARRWLEPYRMPEDDTGDKTMLSRFHPVYVPPPPPLPDGPVPSNFDPNVEPGQTAPDVLMQGMGMGVGAGGYGGGGAGATGVGGGVGGGYGAGAMSGP